MNKILSNRSFSRRLTRGLVLAGVVGAFAVAGISTVSAQETSGSIFGKAPAGDSVTVRSDMTGAGRTVTVDSTGRYFAHALPMGPYTVTLKQNDQDIAKHLNVPVTVGRGVEVDFKCGDEVKCDEVANTK
ncbi:carboxypeptidase-like regulatory domain-containing protein [Rhodanobacter sp. DHG33]|uniref:carboxypeptidase-like regulatory domain-containing protein n=1 Tax=Rhodanobacter sp. DHG33 TaxID=2775921 RepID=UPI00177EE0CE|nr:carboxypeptidase-like regulatory domain-containing protein [Rhodanobacter sp. DHG33]MBD8900162.1 carboxypeptidase regulatory-like domain-containing protein [Rhodanobacter sp. DHG33]